MLRGFRRGFEFALEWIVIVLMVTLAVEVTVGVIFRYSGYALAWYDEVASILLAWVTYYGAALAALKRSHIGVPELVRIMPAALRLPIAMFAEACVFGFFILLAWVGYSVLEILAFDTLVSLPHVSVAYAQSVIPIGAVLFIIAEAFALPEILREARRPPEGPARSAEVVT
ncbi:MAG: TRAP transporter small permease [Burkholderiaceae bacterium]